MSKKKTKIKKEKTESVWERWRGGPQGELVRVGQIGRCKRWNDDRVGCMQQLVQHWCCCHALIADAILNQLSPCVTSLRAASFLLFSPSPLLLLLFCSFFLLLFFVWFIPRCNFTSLTTIFDTSNFFSLPNTLTFVPLAIHHGARDIIIPSSKHNAENKACNYSC